MFGTETMWVLQCDWLTSQKFRNAWMPARRTGKWHIFWKKKKSAVSMWDFISFIIRTGAHWTRELDPKFALQRLFWHFYVILYYDSKYMCITTIFLIRKVNWGKCDYMVNFMDFCRWAWDICVVSLCQAVGPRGFLFFFLFLRSVASAILEPGTASHKLPSSE